MGWVSGVGDDEQYPQLMTRVSSKTVREDDFCTKSAEINGGLFIVWIC